MNDRMRLARFSLAAGVAMTALAAFSSEAAAQTETAIGTTFALADPATVTGSADDGAANAGPEDEIIVSGRYNYLKEDTRGTTNLPLPIEEVPQSITLVSSDFIEAAGLNTIGEIAEYTPGAINAGNTGGTGSVIKLRGFSPGYAIDGINIIQNATYHEYDFAIFDRLEVVKGPSSVVYGVSSPGGLVNLVTRGAKASTPSYIDVEVGSWQNYRAEGQVAGALDAQDDVRAIGIGVYDQGDSFLKENSHKRTVLYAGLDFSLSPSLSGFLHGGYENFDRTSFDGTPALPDGSRAPVPKSFCLCSSNISLESSVYHAEGSLTWNASSMLELSLRGNYQQLKTSGQVAYASGLQSNGDINLTVQGNRAEVVNFGILEARAQTGETPTQDIAAVDYLFMLDGQWKRPR